MRSDMEFRFELSFTNVSRIRFEFEIRRSAVKSEFELEIHFKMIINPPICSVLS